MTLIASDGYEYADLTQRILGRPLKNTRNNQLVSFRFRRTEEGYVKAWLEGYDGAEEDALGGKRWANASLAAYAYASAHPDAARR